MTASDGAPDPAAALAASPTRITTGDQRPTGGVHGARSQPPAHRPSWAEIDLDAIAGNVARLKAQAAAPALMAVVKADGYGHGLVPAARAALRGGADWLSVALVEEGLVLRREGITAPVLVLTEPPPTAVDALLAADLTPTVYSPAFTDALAAAGDERRRAGGPPVDVHIKLDTGMRRVGVPQAEWEEAFRRVDAAGGLRLQSIWSHFAVADEPHHPYIAAQASEFDRALRLARGLGVPYDFAHLCNSAGTLHLHDHHHDMVRPGLAIYGLEPAPGLAGSTRLEPALAWFSRLSLVKDLAAAEAVSYGLTWAPAEPTRLGSVPLGYADGVTRTLSNLGEVVVGGRRVPIAGRVCMDQFLVDLGAGEGAAGDEVCLIGHQGGAGVSADDWAQWLATINYEVTCTVGARVPRVYLGGGEAGT